MLEYSENEIEQQVRAGDPDAFYKWVEKHKEKAVNIAYSLCADYEEAKDISQKAFIKMLRTINNFKGESKLYTWFYRILVNLCKDYLREKKLKSFIRHGIRFKPGEADSENADIFETIASGAPSPKEALLSKELGEKLTGAINSLPEKQKTVFTLKNIHGLTIKEICEITKSAEGTIKANLFKATANLQVKLSGYLTAEGSGR